MNRYLNALFAICILSTSTIFLFLVAGCSPSSRTVISERDTLYVERIMDRETIVRDTIETSTRMVEYVIDSSGDWRPQKMVEKRALRFHTQKTGEEETTTETSSLSSNSEIMKERTIKTEWYMFGLGFLLIFLALLMVRH